MKKVAQRSFRGFHPEAFRFFRRLARNNHKAWFDRNRAIYDEHVAGALRGLLEALVPTLLELHPGFEVSGKTGRNFSRINRDIRFARDKSPYRTNYYLYFGQRHPEASGPGTRLYVGLSADGVTCGFAAYSGRHSANGRESALARLLKPRRAENPAALDRLLRRLAKRYECYWHGMQAGEWKKYLGYPKTDKDWKRCKAFIVRRRFPPSRAELRAAGFVHQVAKIFRDLFPLYALAALE